MDQVRAAPRAIDKPETPAGPRWCRLQFSVQRMARPGEKLLSIDRGPRTLRVTVNAPERVMWGLARLLGLAVFGSLLSQPWFPALVHLLLSWFGIHF